MRKAAGRAFGELAAKYAADVIDRRLQPFAERLGVTTDSLRALGIGWTGREWSFPMFDDRRRVVGIRLRNASTGSKYAVTGSRDGVFLGSETNNDSTMLVVEGPTDAAAALDLGYAVIGRPSCTGATRPTAQLLRGKNAVLMADADGPGRRGAEALATAMLPYVKSLRVVEPPAAAKDLRGWLTAGATRSDVDTLIAAARVRRLEVRHV